MNRLRRILLLFISSFTLWACGNATIAEPPIRKDECRAEHNIEASIRKSLPIPFCHPIPSLKQLAWQRMELIMFIHFGINTFTGNEWGTGRENPDIFRPGKFNADQWVELAVKTGFKGIILTAKHHDGFCLWPSKHTEFSVKNSSWLQNKGDVVKSVSESCSRHGIKFGVYLSPWDMNSNVYGTGLYDDYYINTLTELLTGYGDIFEVWFDAAHPDSINPSYDFRRYWTTCNKLQPEAVLAIIGPDIRWVGNEIGMAPDTLWSFTGNNWQPTETDVSIRPRWFFKDTLDNQPKQLDHLVDIYFQSVGRNSVLLLNVPPNKDGLIVKADSIRLVELSDTINALFKENKMSGATVQTSSVQDQELYWSGVLVGDNNHETFWYASDIDSLPTIEISFCQETKVSIISLAEPIEYGQRISEFSVEALVDGQYRILYTGATIGYKRLIRLKQSISTKGLRIRIPGSRSTVAISEIGVY